MSDLLHRQKRLKTLPVQVAHCQAMAVGFELYQIPLIQFASFQSKMLNIEQV